MFNILAGALTMGNIAIDLNDSDQATINKRDPLQTVGVRASGVVSLFVWWGRAAAKQALLGVDFDKNIRV